MTKSRPMAAIDKGQREECVADIENTLDYWERSYLGCEDDFTCIGIHLNTLSIIYKTHAIMYPLCLKHSYYFFFYKFASRKGSRTSVFLSSAILELQRTPKSQWFAPINADFWFMFSVGCQSAMAPLHSSAWLQGPFHTLHTHALRLLPLETCWTHLLWRIEANKSSRRGTLKKTQISRRGKRFNCTAFPSSPARAFQKQLFIWEM